MTSLLNGVSGKISGGKPDQDLLKVGVHSSQTQHIRSGLEQRTESVAGSSMPVLSIESEGLVCKQLNAQPAQQKVIRKKILYLKKQVDDIKKQVILGDKDTDIDILLGGFIGSLRAFDLTLIKVNESSDLNTYLFVQLVEKMVEFLADESPVKDKIEQVLRFWLKPLVQPSNSEILVILIHISDKSNDFQGLIFEFFNNTEYKEKNSWYSCFMISNLKSQDYNPYLSATAKSYLESVATPSQRHFLDQLLLFRQEPMLWHLREFGSLDGFKFDFETSFTFTSIEEGEYEVVLACLRTIKDELQKQRAIKGLYGAIALKQLCGGFQDKCRALKDEFSDLLKTHEISGREVLKQSDAIIKGIDKSDGEKVFYAFSGTKVCSDSPQNNEERKAFLQEIRGHCDKCLSGQEQWLKHFYLDHGDGIGDKDFLNFNAQHTCDFKEVEILKGKFRNYIDVNFGEYELQWDTIVRNNFQSRALAAFNGDPKCREHEDFDLDSKISFCYMVTDNDYKPEDDGMGMYITQKEEKHTSLMRDNQFLMFPSRALHGSDLGNEPDLDASLDSAPCRVVQNLRVELFLKEGGEPVTKEKVAEILEGFYKHLQNPGE